MTEHTLKNAKGNQSQDQPYSDPVVTDPPLIDCFVQACSGFSSGSGQNFSVPGKSKGGAPPTALLSSPKGIPHSTRLAV